MAIQYGTVERFVPCNAWGFAIIDGTETRVFLHKNQRHLAVRFGPKPDDVELRQCGPREPRQGDKLVMETIQLEKGLKATAWAFRSDWDAALKSKRIVPPVATNEEAPHPGPTEKSARMEPSVLAFPARKPEAETAVAIAPPPPASVVVAPAPVVPKVEPPLTFGEMLEVLNYPFLHALLEPLEKGELTVVQLQNFVRNTLRKKKGEALWDEFHKRKAHRRDKKYGIASFIKEFLVEAGFLVEE